MKTMENLIKFFKSKLALNILVALLSSFIISTFILMIIIRDNIFYIIPHKEKMQDETIDRLMKYEDETRTIISDKNKNTNYRINQITDGWSVLLNKIDAISKNQDEQNFKINFIFKKVKELKPYSDFLMDRNCVYDKKEDNSFKNYVFVKDSTVIDKQ